MPSTLVYLNGWPGTGKLTIAKQLVSMLDMRLILDNHKVIDLASTIAPRSSDAYLNVRAQLLESAVLAALSTAVPGGVNSKGFIMTGAHAGGEFDTGVFSLVQNCVEKEANRRRDAGLEKEEDGVVLVGIVLTVSDEENERRLVGEGRQMKLKSVETLRTFRKRELLGGLPNELVLDITEMTATDAALAIKAHVDKFAV